jgi:hypothetical protein
LPDFKEVKVLAADLKQNISRYFACQKAQDDLSVPSMDGLYLPY